MEPSGAVRDVDPSSEHRPWGKIDAMLRLAVVALLANIVLGWDGGLVLCFGGDGHSAVERLRADHPLVNDGPSGAPAIGSVRHRLEAGSPLRGGHGPCRDLALEPNAHWRAGLIDRAPGHSGAVVPAVPVAPLLLAHHVAVPWYARHRSPLKNEEMVRRFCEDPDTPIVCYPRGCDSVAFYLRRDDLLQFRSKETKAMIDYLQQQPQVVILCTHRHSIDILREVLPQNDLRITFEAPLFGSAKLGPKGDCWMAVVQPLKAFNGTETICIVCNRGESARPKKMVTAGA